MPGTPPGLAVQHLARRKSQPRADEPLGEARQLSPPRRGQFHGGGCDRCRFVFDPGFRAVEVVRASDENRAHTTRTRTRAGPGARSGIVPAALSRAITSSPRRGQSTIAAAAVIGYIA